MLSKDVSQQIKAIDIKGNRYFNLYKTLQNKQKKVINIRVFNAISTLFDKI